ncbi:MAG: dynamin family protein [Desulfococcaceae bacterium]
MEKFSLFKNELLQINDRILNLLSEARSIPGIGDHTFDHWERTCEEIRKRVSEDVLRVAVVGAIKSGKSTFVNSLFGGDYLRRGAGVVTSIVTRIRKGDALKATLYFKSWDQVNSEMEAAMALFPTTDWRTEKGPFDIRRESDRQALKKALASLNTDLLISNDSRNTDSVLLICYLNGYDRVKEIIDVSPVVHEYEGANFVSHKEYSGDDVLSVYLNDIRLDIDAGDMDETIEIADCQGSDSPNPLHLAMIQDYLLLTHLIVYVISARTGLRQADIKFLSQIKKMGIIENTLFLINVDFGEHETIDDMKRVESKIKEELSLIKSDPDVYTVSALFNLFKGMEKDLNTKDRLRMAQWKGELRFAEYSDKETERFRASIRQKLTRERYSLLLQNHLERMRTVLSGFAHWIAVNTDLLKQDAQGVKRIVDGVQKHQKNADQIKSMIRSTLDGATAKLQKTLRTDVDRFFDAHTGIVGDLLRHLKNYAVPFQEYEQTVASAGFSNALYQVFQEVKRGVDAYIAETVNPEVVRFVREEEEKIREHFELVTGSYDAMIMDALSEYRTTLEELGITAFEDEFKRVYLPDISAMAENAGIKFPPAAASMQYTATIRSEAVMRLGWYRTLRFIKQVFKRPLPESKEALFALEDGALRLKRETKKSLLFHFKDYRENLKFQYILKLADAVSDYLYDALQERLETYVADLSKVSELIRAEGIDPKGTSELLQQMDANREQLAERVHSLKREIEAVS